MLLLDVLHQVVEDILRLQLFFFSLASLGLFDIENLAFVFQRCLKVTGLDLSRDEILVHELKHVSVCALSHLLKVDFVLGFFQVSIQLR